MPTGEPYPSVTACEVLTALEARAEAEFPDVVILRKTEQLRVPVDDAGELERAQLEWRRLQSFLDRALAADQRSNSATVRNFATTDELAREVETLLRAWIETHVLGGHSLASSVTWSIATRGSPFCALAPFDAEHAPVFFGRARDCPCGRSIAGRGRAQDPVPAHRRRRRRRQIVAGAGGHRAAAHRARRRCRGRHLACGAAEAWRAAARCPRRSSRPRSRRRRRGRRAGSLAAGGRSARRSVRCRSRGRRARSIRRGIAAAPCERTGLGGGDLARCV